MAGAVLAKKVIFDRYKNAAVICLTKDAFGNVFEDICSKMWHSTVVAGFQSMGVFNVFQ